MPDVCVGSTRDIINPNSMTFDEREEQLKKQEEAEKQARKRQKDSPYSNWYQFNREYTKEMIWLAGNHPKAHQILLFLLDQMDSYNAVMCSYKVFQEALEMSDSTSKRAVKVLKDHGFITVYKSGSSNIYAVNKQLAWSSWGNNFKYAKFGANIVITESEQEILKDIESVKHKELTIRETTN